jgi:hypothetical protein
MPRNGINKGRKKGSLNKKEARGNTVSFRLDNANYDWVMKKPDTREYLTGLIVSDRSRCKKSNFEDIEKKE